MRKTFLTCVVMFICSLASLAIPPTDREEKAMSSFNPKTQTQQVMLPQSNVTLCKDVTCPAVKNFLDSKGYSISHTHTGGSSVNGRVTPQSVPTRENQQTYNLTVNLNYDKEEVGGIFEAVAFPSYTNEYWFFNNWTMEDTPDYIEFSLPGGEYDVEVILQTHVGDFILLSTSDVNISSDKEILLDASDATIEISWNPLMPNGDVPTCDISVYDPDTFEILKEVPGNVLAKSCSLNFFNVKHNVGATAMFNEGAMIVGEEKIEFGRGKINAIPNKDYVLYYSMSAIGSDGGYIVPLFTKLDKSAEIRNNIVNYKNVNPIYAKSPYKPEPLIFEEGDYKEIFEFDKDNSFSLNFFEITNGNMSGLVQLSLSATKENIKQTIHVCQDPNLSDEYQVMPVPGYKEDWNKYMFGLPINLQASSPMALAINNTSPFNTYLMNPYSRSITMSEVSNPWISFDVNNQYVWNYGCPALVFTTSGYEVGAYYEFAYIGRLGENRGVDNLCTEAMVSVNDEMPSNEVLEDLQWGQLPKEGKIYFEFSNTNVAIDELNGKNISHISFDMSLSDWQPPTLQLVRFIDTEGNINDRYANGDEGIIEIYGGDFQYNIDLEEDRGWYTEIPAAEVTLEYAPYGTDYFLPIEVEHIAERDFMPGFGSYYRGSLKDVDRNSENGWFDARITLIDTAGNFQQQTLSPAFKIENNVGIESAKTSDVELAVINSIITVTGCNKPIIEIYSTSGSLIKTVKTTTCDITGLGHGIYLVTVKDGKNSIVRKIAV